MMRSLTLAAAALLATVSLAAIPAQADDSKLHPIAADVASQLADDDKPFVLIVELEVEDENAEAFVAAVAAAAAETAKEPGNLAYDLSRSVNDPEEFVLYERWESVAALDAHLKQPYLVKLLEQLHRLVEEEPELEVCVPLVTPEK